MILTVYSHDELYCMIAMDGMHRTGYSKKKKKRMRIIIWMNQRRIVVSLVC